jgi:PAS domain S-box-containing protein
MASLTGLIQAAGLLFLILTAAGAAYAAWRHRDTHRLNIFAVVVAPLVASLPRGTGLPDFVAPCLLVAQPFFLLRLVHHFREVPSVVRYSAVIVMATGAALNTVAAPALQIRFGPAIAGLGAALFVYAAVAFTREASRTSGVTAMRLVFAGAGTWMLSAVFVTTGAALTLPGLGRIGGALNDLFTASLAACYFLAFNPPRRLRARWQRAEQARYLSAVADRDAEDRGREAAADLERAAQRSVGNAAILVALGTGEADSDFIVRASSGVAADGLVVTPRTANLIGHAVQRAEAVDGLPSACEPEIAARLAPIGSSVLVAPISSATHTWGAIVVAQRRGSLFPEDDLRLLAQLSRYAATALDHARLVAEARARERLVADRRVHAIESLMSLTLGSIKDYAMCLFDSDGRIVAWHGGAERLFGYTAAEIAGEPGGTLFSLAPGDFSELLDKAEIQDRAEHEGLCLRKDGSKFVGATVIRTLEREPTDPMGYVAVTRDVTEQRDLESRLRQSQKMEAVGQLAGGIAHDFNNLLTAILGNADFLVQKVDPKSAGHHEIAAIHRAAERAAQLTRQLLAFSRKRMLEATPVGLPGLIEDLLPMLRRLIGEQVEIEHVAPARAVSAILGDRAQIEQIVINLAVNARDAMPRGGRLTLRTSDVMLDGPAAAGDLSPGSHVLFEVTDTGIGMDEATRARIFEPFFTTKEFGLGTGLGLATVYGIVKQMNGAIRVESTPGRGTTFRLYFPATAARQVDVPVTTARDLPGGTETVLLVEDDEGVRTFLGSTLKRYGYNVLTAGHPAAAVSIAQTFGDPIHLLIADVVMPGSSGVDLSRTIGELRPGIPTLYISGYADAVLARQGTVPKASQFLQKPFTAGDLLTRVRQIMQS